MVSCEEAFEVVGSSWDPVHKGCILSRSRYLLVRWDHPRTSVLCYHAAVLARL